MRQVYHSPWFWLVIAAAALSGEYIPPFFH